VASHHLPTTSSYFLAEKDSEEKTSSLLFLCNYLLMAGWSGANALLLSAIKAATSKDKIKDNLAMVWKMYCYLQR
jgi:hypothetical protein